MVVSAAVAGENADGVFNCSELQVKSKLLFTVSPRMKKGQQGLAPFTVTARSSKSVMRVRLWY